MSQPGYTDAAPTDMLDPWEALHAELDAHAAAGRVATLWWRDDDATEPSPAVDRLIEVTRQAGAPLLLAVIPARAQDGLAGALAGASHIRIAQHGYAHINHAPRGRGLGAWELGLHRGAGSVLADLALGRDRLERLFADVFLPVVVPPWNRIDAALLPDLARAGYRGVSAFGPRGAPEAAPGLALVNAHCDPIRWKEGARFAGTAKSLGALIGHLQARRLGTADPDEPTGFLTHHLDLDEAGWAFARDLAAAVAAHDAARWCEPAAIFGTP